MIGYISCEIPYVVFENGMWAWFTSRYLFHERILDRSQTPLSTQQQPLFTFPHIRLRNWKQTPFNIYPHVVSENTGNTQMIHSAWLDTQQTLGSLIVRATSINNRISIHRSPARLALCATWFYFCQKDLNPSSSSGLSLYEKLSAIKR